MVSFIRNGIARWQSGRMLIGVFMVFWGCCFFCTFCTTGRAQQAQYQGEPQEGGASVAPYGATMSSLLQKGQDTGQVFTYTNTRNVICKLNGAVVADSVCEAAGLTKPTTTQTCSVNGCNASHDDRSGGGGGSSGGKVVFKDTDGDGKGDTQITDKSGCGASDCSDTRGGPTQNTNFLSGIGCGGSGCSSEDGPPESLVD